MNAGRPFTDTPPMPEHSTDSTGVITGNEDLGDSSRWDPPQGEPERPVLPGHEHQIDPEAKAWPWLTERRADVACLAIAALAFALRFGAGA